MRALDGTYWRVKHCYKGHTHTYNCYLRDDNGCSLVTFENHDAKPETIPKCSKLVRIRPRMSIVRAMQLLTEARKQGVELWMRREDMRNHEEQWRKIDDGEVWLAHKTRFAPPSVMDISKAWIVATPEDARRIDARKVSK